MEIKAKDIKPGTRLRFSAGWNHSEVLGTAYGRHPSRFYGHTCRVKLDNGTWDSILSAYTDPKDRSANGSPIGWYFLNPSPSTTPTR